MGLGFSFQIFGAETKIRIQNILKDIYLSTLSPLSGKNLIIEKGKTEGTLAGSGKNSMVRKHLLGKTIDWTASNVITAPENSKANRPEDKPVPFGKAAFPLATLLSLFQPFFLNFCSDFLEEYLSRFANDFASDIKKIDVGQYNPEAIEKLIKRFIKDTEDRFEPLPFEYTNLNGEKVKKYIPFFEFTNEEDAKNDVNYRKRPFTMADLFFIAAKAVLVDKHVYVTRYPVTYYQNIFPAGVKILTTAKTREIYYKFTLGPDYKFEKEYPTVPWSDVKKNDYRFLDVMICGNAYLDAIGGDYDSLESHYIVKYNRKYFEMLETPNVKSRAISRDIKNTLID